MRANGNTARRWLGDAWTRRAASGIPAGGEFLVNQQTANVTEWPAVAGDAAGNVLVSWAVDAQDGDARGVFARPYDPWGNPLAPEFQVNTFTTGFQSLPSVALGRHGDAVVAWTSLGQDAPSSAGVFGQRYSDLIFGDGLDPSGP